MRWFWLALTLILGICSIEVVQAFIGNSLLGPKLCVVGCGRGPLGIAPLGDLIKGGNEALFGPTVDNFEQSGKRVVDYAGTKADEQIKKALTDLQGVLAGERKQIDQSIVDRLADLDAISQESLQALDESLRKSLDEGDRMLEARFGSLNTIGITQVAAIEITLHRVVVFAAIMSFVWFFVVKLYPEYVNGLNRRRVIAKTVVCLTGILVLILGYFLLPNQRVVEDLARRHLDAYNTGIGDLDFRSASFHAVQLRTLDFFDKDYRFLAEKSSLMRDVFYRPTSYKTIEGLRETETQLRALLETKRDSDVEAMFLLVTWQARRDRYTQYLVANGCSQLLEMASRHGANTFALAPIALHYLNSYLTNPLADRELEILGKDFRQAKEGAPDDIYSTLYKFQNLATLRASLNAAQQNPIFANTQKSPLYSSIAYGSITSKMYRTALPSYMGMANAQALLAAETDPARIKVLTEARTVLAGKLVAAWDDWTEAMGSASIDFSVSQRVSIMQGLHATYARAKSYAASTTPDVPKATLPAAQLFHAKWLESSIRGFVRPQGFRVLQGQASKAFLDDEMRLVAFETTLVEAQKAIVAKSGESVPKARAAASAAADLGIFGCRTASLECGKGDEPVNGIWLIRDKISPDLRPEDIGWANQLKHSLVRTVPIL
jgi:hypothetical protein